MPTLDERCVFVCPDTNYTRMSRFDMHVLRMRVTTQLQFVAHSCRVYSRSLFPEPQNLRPRFKRRGSTPAGTPSPA
jgi:hypothetical protein